MDTLRLIGRSVYGGALGNPAGSVGTKAVVALSGLLLWGWTCLHLLGTLTVFAGADSMEHYAAWLRRGAGVPLWALRALLLSALVLHVRLVLGLWARARRARPVGYAGAGANAPSSGVRALRWGSVLLLALIVAHVLHLSFGVGHPGFDPHHAYANLVSAFESLPVLLGYLALSALFAWHLGHGLSAALVSLGLRLGERARRVWASAWAVALGLGFAAIPLAIRLGVVR
jgi:succinate dehydrogenase / fumarate reductase cytochrome b subunit